MIIGDTGHMDSFYEVLGGSTGNVIKDYPSEEAGLAELTMIARTHGIEEIKNLVLMRFEDGRPSLVAAEEELIARLVDDDSSRRLLARKELSLKP
jgi:hypothetical protein